MREILFRGKKRNGEWIYGCLVILFCETGIFDVAEGEFVDAETVGQFTGLSDKNGTKIFEGDIVRLISVFEDYSITYMGVIHIGKHDFGNPTNYGCYVEWHYSREKDYLREDLLFWIDENLDPFEVIGNIYDNPELLEVKDNEEL